MTKRVLMTIVLKCYAHQAFFEESFSSALAQRSDTTKIIVYDNGSTGQYAKTIQETCKAHDVPLIRARRNRHRSGLHVDVFPIIDSEYFSLLFDDDTFSPDRSAILDPILEAEKPDYLFHNVQVIKPDGVSATPRDIFEGFNTQNFPPINPNNLTEAKARFLVDFLTPPSGTRLRFIGLVLRTDMIQPINWDPFYHRVDDMIFFTKLLTNPVLKGRFHPARLSNVVMHNSNDSLYAKFDPHTRTVEQIKLQLDEAEIFKSVINCNDEALCRAYLSKMFDKPDDDSYVALLLSVAHEASLVPLYSSSSHALNCFRLAMQIDRQEVYNRCATITGFDTEVFASQILTRHVANFATYGAAVANHHDHTEQLEILRQQLDSVLKSNSWRITAPLRALSHFLLGRR